jgi:hypothetical protein
MAYDLPRYYGPPLLCRIARHVQAPLLSYGMGRMHSSYFVTSCAFTSCTYSLKKILSDYSEVFYY